MSSQPIVDPQNPLYCPSISANTYLSQVLTQNQNQHTKKQAQKSNHLGILVSKGENKRSARNKDGTISSFIRMLGHWHDGFVQARDREGLAVDLNHCMDFGTPDINRPKRKNGKVNCVRKAQQTVSKTMKKGSGPRTRSRAQAQTRIDDVDDRLKVVFMTPTKTSSPVLPTIDVETGGYKMSNDSCHPFETVVWPGSSESSPSTIASPTFPLLQRKPHSDVAVLSPPGLNDDQAHSTLFHQPMAQAHTTLTVKSVAVLAPASQSNNSRVMKTTFYDGQPHKCHRSILRLESRKRKLAELFPDLLCSPDSGGRTKRYRGMQKTPLSEQPWNADRDEDERSQSECLTRISDLQNRYLYYDSSFSPMERRREALTARTDIEDRIKMLEDALYGHPIGTESPRGYKLLLDKLETMMPGIRLRERLLNVSFDPHDLLPYGQHYDGDGSNWEGYTAVKGRGRIRERSHQGVADFLGEEGLLNERVMEILRTSEIEHLEMGPSLADEGGLNLGGRDAFKVFGKPNSFLFLSELSFSGTPVNDIDLLHIIRLPKLRRLWLEDTGIGDEAIYHLTGLRNTLCALSLASNPRISDDAVPALILLTKLGFLSLVGTDIGMNGLRKLAVVVDREKRVVDVEIPERCEIYVANLETNVRYLLHIQPPLISLPSLCSHLSMGALKRNLDAHLNVAAVRGQVQASATQSQVRINGAGASSSSTTDVVDFLTKEEMKERLEGILRMREVDLLVRGMIFG